MSERFTMPSTEAVDLTGRTILQVVPELETGGAEITTWEMAEAIVKAGGRALVASEGGSLSTAIEKAGGEIFNLPVASKNPFTMWANIRRLAQLMRDEKVDLIHGRSRAPCWSSLLAARRVRRPYLATYHSKVHETPRLKVFYNSVMTRGRLTIANSHFTAARIFQVHGIRETALRVIPRGCDPAALDRKRFSEADIKNKRAQWGVPASAFVIICPARLTSWKGQHILLHAVHQLKSDTAPYVVCVGDAQGRDEYVETLKAITKSTDMQNRLVLAGHENDMPAAYAAADLAVMPSTIAEPFGRTTIEAQAASLPVIASDAGGFRETVIAKAADAGGSGFLVTPDHAEDLAAAIDEALAMSVSERQKLGENGRVNVLENYTRTAMCNRTLQVYKELIG